MPWLRGFRPSGRSGALFCAAAWLVWPTPAGADLITRENMENGLTITRAQCAALPEAVWVRAFGQDFCIRYYASTAGGEGRKPVVFLEGDVIVDKMEKPRDTNNFTKRAERLSKMAKVPGIYLARPGYDGSSGHIRMRHKWIELQAVNAALDAIKQRHKFDGFHLIGQSGGAMVIGGLLGLRRDIGCAVPGAGVLARTGTPPPGIQLRDRMVNAAAAIDWIVRNSKARILVVTDPQDKIVAYGAQTRFVKALRKAGGKAEQYFVEATDEKHHGVMSYSMSAVSACIRGAPPIEISAGLARMRARFLAAKAQREAAEAANNESPATPARPRAAPNRT